MESKIKTQAIKDTGFRHVAVIRLRHPTGDLLQDTESMLAALPGILPSKEAHFDVRLALTGIYVERGQLPKAASQLEQASLRMPDDSRARRHLAQAHCDLGEAYEERGSLRRARLAYKTALSVHPDSARASRLLNKTRAQSQ